MRIRVLGLVTAVVFVVAITACGNGDGETADTTIQDDSGSGCAVCEYEGACFEAGESFDASDGCNTCACLADGEVTCSAEVCVVPDEGPPPEDEGTEPTDDGPEPIDEGEEPVDEGTIPSDSTSDAGGAQDSAVVLTDEGSLDIPGEPIDAPTGPPGDATGPTNNPTWTNAIKPKFSQKCAGCHTGGNSGAHNCLSVYDDCLEPSNTCPGKTVGACLLDRINDGSMPPAGDFIPPDWKDDLEAWVNAGMPE